MTEQEYWERHAERKLAKSRWRAIQDRMDARAWREHLALCEPDEPIFRAMAHTDNEGE